MGVRDGINPNFLHETGWGVVFPAKTDPEVYAALKPLLQLRADQARAYYREYDGSKGVRVNENKTAWLARQGAGPGPANPENVPYYLLLVGSPEEIPFRFQSQLDVQYAVGRIHFDTPEEYSRYANSVVRAETAAQRLAKKLVVLSPNHPADGFTSEMQEKLVQPLTKQLLQSKDNDWNVSLRAGELATKVDFARHLGGADRTALVLTIGHGLSLPPDHPCHRDFQGGLVCQGWELPRKTASEIRERLYFSASGLSETAVPLGQVTMHLSSYSAGVPRFDEIAEQFFKGEKHIVISKESTVSRLAQRLLAHPNPNGGSLAFIGVVDRVAGFAFQSPKAVAAFQWFFLQLMNGKRTGFAVEGFNNRYAEVSTNLTNELEEISFGKNPDQQEIVQMWCENNLMRSLILIGDPAVRAMV